MSCYTMSDNSNATSPVTSPEKKKEGGTIMPEELVRVMIRLTLEQHEWLRKYCFDNRISQAEVLRQALEIYRQELAKKEQRKG